MIAFCASQFNRTEDQLESVNPIYYFSEVMQFIMTVLYHCKTQFSKMFMFGMQKYCITTSKSHVTFIVAITQVSILQCGKYYLCYGTMYLSKTDTQCSSSHHSLWKDTKMIPLLQFWSRIQDSSHNTQSCVNHLVPDGNVPGAPTIQTAEDRGRKHMEI